MALHMGHWQKTNTQAGRSFFPTGKSNKSEGLSFLFLASWLFCFILCPAGK